MKARSWILFLASRYLKASRRDKGLSSAYLSIISLSLGVMALIAVLGVMNGFQLGFMENIMEVSSSHIRIGVDELLDPTREKTLEEAPGVRSALPLVDSQTLIKSYYSSSQGAFIRGLPPDALARDEGLQSRLEFLEGEWDLEAPDRIILGSELARRLGVSTGDTVSLLALTGPSFSLLKPKEMNFTVTGIFRTGYLELDAGWGFLPLQTALEFLAGEEDLLYGVKLQDPEQDRAALSHLGKLVPEAQSLVSWREFNSSFFGALRLEKTAMMVLIGLIFLIVGGNIYQSLRRSLRERVEEIGLMKAVGAPGAQVRTVFLAEGAIIGLVSGLTGVLLGLGLALNINEVLEFLQSLFLRGSLLFGSGEEALSPSQVFYLDRIPVRVLPQEVVLVFVFAVLSSTASAWLATRRVEEIKPALVLRAE